MAWSKSDIHTCVYPWISIFTATLVLTQNLTAEPQPLLDKFIRLNYSWQAVQVFS